MEFLLKGFDQAASVRRFTFDSAGPLRSRTTVVVSADLTLLHRYGIQIQSLPLMCRRILESSDATEIAAGTLTITAADMAAAGKAERELAEQKKKSRTHPRTPAKP